MSIPANFDKNTTSEEVAEHFKTAIQGKNILITGASPKGLGAAFAQAVSRHSPGLLVLAGRTQKALDETKAELLKETPKLNVRLLIVDFASLESVRKAAAEVLAYEENIDVFVANAGVMGTAEGKTDDGIETQFGVNHVGPFLFTNLLLEGSSKPPPKRIVVVSSGAQQLFPGGVNFEQPGYVLDKKDVYDKWVAYGQSKASNVLLAAALHRRGHEAVSLHPGVIQTSLTRHMSEDDYRSAGWVNEDGSFNTAVELKSVSQGAATHIVAAFAPSAALFPTGAPAPYLDDCQIALDHVDSTAKGVEQEEKLWKLSEQLVGRTFA